MLLQLFEGPESRFRDPPCCSLFPRLRFTQSASADFKPNRLSDMKGKLDRQDLIIREGEPPLHAMIPEP